MISTCPLILKSSSLSTILWWLYPEHQLQIVSPSLSYSIDFSIPWQGEVLNFLYIFFQLYLWSAGTAKPLIWQVLFFLFIITRSGRLVEIKWSICISKSQRSFFVSFSRTYSKLCIYHLFVWLNFIFLHNYQWITIPNQSCLILYSFCTNLLHSLIMWLIVLYSLCAFPLTVDDVLNFIAVYSSHSLTLLSHTVTPFTLSLFLYIYIYIYIYIFILC